MTAPSDNADNPTKNQHYVPQGYLRNFSTKDQIFAYDKSERRKFKTNVRNVAAETYFYDSDELEKITGDRQFIEKYLRRSEALYADLVRGLIESLDAGTFRTIKPITRHFMSVYMILQMIRTKEAMLFGHHMAEAFVNMTKNAHRDAGLPPPTSEHILAGQSTAEIARDNHQLALLDGGQIKMMAGIIYQHIWVIKRAYQDEVFFTSDNPFGKRPHIKGGWRSMCGIQSEGIEIAFPFSSRYLLSLYERTHFKKMAILDGCVKDLWCSDNMIYYNQFQIVASTRYVFSKMANFDFVEFLLNDQPIHGNPERPRVKVM